MDNRDNHDSEPEEESTYPQEEPSFLTGTPMSQAGIQSTPRSEQSQRSQRSQHSQFAGSPFSQVRSQRVGGSPFTSSQTHWGSTPVTGTLPRGDVGRSSTASTRLHNNNTTTTNNTSSSSNMYAASPVAVRRAGGRMEPGTPGTPMSMAGYSPANPRTTNNNNNNTTTIRRTGANTGVAGIGLEEADDMELEHDTTFALDPEEELQLQQNLAETRIWGTDVSIESSRNVFRVFVNYYGVQDSAADGGSVGVGYYKRQLQIMHHTGDMLLNLNCSHLKAFPGTRQFYKQLQQWPQEMIPIIDNVMNTMYKEMFGELDGNRQVCVRPYGMEEQSRMRGLDPKDIDQLLCIKGMVTRCSAVIPDLKVAFFRCYNCSHTLEVMIDKGRIEEPKSCPQCQALGSMELIHNRGRYTDKQLIRLQETPDEIPAGETPHTVTLFAFDDLVDSVRPGDRIEVTGIFRAVPHRANPRLRSVKSIYKTYIDALHFRRAEQGDDRLNVDTGEGPGIDRTVELQAAANTTAIFNNNTASSSNGDINDSSAKQFSNERLSEFYAFANSGNVYERLVKSFAPSIWEMDDVKRGLLCLLFGGTIRRGTKRQRMALRKRALAHIKSSSFTHSGGSGYVGGIESKRQRGDGSSEGSRGDDSMDEGSDESDSDSPDNLGSTSREDQQGGVHQRGDINVLLCGDPGTSKSQLLSYVHKLTPRGIYTSGKGSSAVGLTASVMRDPETRDMVLESGALVLSDNGICCIDEFDKMTDQTRAILHEAMEQQTVSITKAGIIATLNARTSILASANPVQSRYNAKLSVVENIKLPPTLLSRFDLIYLILDKPQEDSDRKLAKHLVSLYYDDNEVEEVENSGVVDQKFLRDYILYARNNICPEISDEAAEVLVHNYVEMRSLGGRSMKTITATPRQLESLIRLSQALAKMRLSETVTARDVLEATRLMKVATQTAATDPRTGTIDMDMITTGQTALGRESAHQLAEEVRKYLQAEYAQGRTSTTANQIYQGMRHNLNNSTSAHNSGEYELSVEKIQASIDILVEDKVVAVLRSKTISVLPAIVSEY